MSVGESLMYACIGTSTAWLGLWCFRRWVVGRIWPWPWASSASARHWHAFVRPDRCGCGNEWPCLDAVPSKDELARRRADL